MHGAVRCHGSSRPTSDHSPARHAKKQIARLEAMGLSAMMATELEFFLFEESFDESHAQASRSEPISAYNEDYHIFQTTKEEDVMRAVRNHLFAPVSRLSVPRARPRPARKRLNFKYADALTCADNHSIAKTRRQGNRLAAGPGSHVPAQMAL